MSRIVLFSRSFCSKSHVNRRAAGSIPEVGSSRITICKKSMIHHLKVYIIKEFKQSNFHHLSIIAILLDVISQYFLFQYLPMMNGGGDCQSHDLTSYHRGWMGNFLQLYSRVRTNSKQNNGKSMFTFYNKTLRSQVRD